MTVRRIHLLTPRTPPYPLLPPSTLESRGKAARFTIWMSKEEKCPTHKFQRSFEICDPNLDKHAVQRGAWYANSLVKGGLSCRAERRIQQRVDAPPVGGAKHARPPPLLYTPSLSLRLLLWETGLLF
uniref:Uncharacterized protein n=1 Tax=Knipowitschia caucasica TaxID=637954 RepID=A0AAV2L3I0_KNICA